MTRIFFIHHSFPCREFVHGSQEGCSVGCTASGDQQKAGRGQPRGQLASRFPTPTEPTVSYTKVARIIFKRVISQLRLNEEDWPKDNGTDSPNGCTDSEACFCLSIDELSPKIRHRGRGKKTKVKTVQITRSVKWLWSFSSCSLLRADTVRQSTATFHKFADITC
ncbi:hypothetical protein TNCV_2857921 [Trichonephila clavipes]|nr:hypothetical protein TNCV_2857921 [Trichonephila clavipes]